VVGFGGKFITDKHYYNATRRPTRYNVDYCVSTCDDQMFDGNRAGEPDQHRFCWPTSYCNEASEELPDS
jgi:hypothetical protein